MPHTPFAEGNPGAPGAIEQMPVQLPLGRREFAVRLAMIILAAATALLLYRLTELFLLIFAAFLVVIILHSMAAPVARRTGLSLAVSLVMTSALLALFVMAIVMGFGREIANQIELAGERMPQAADQFLVWLNGAGIDSKMLLEAIQETAFAEAGASMAADFLASVLGLIVAIVLAIVGGAYIATQPHLYIRGFLDLFLPEKGREIERIGGLVVAELKLWLAGQLAIMACVGGLTGLGAWLLGLPAPLALGLMAAIFEFIPYVGPILTVVPAVLLGFTVDIETAALMLGWVIAVQQIEGYVLTPLIQRKAVSLPPAVTLFSLVAAGLLLGTAGVLLALPLAVVGHVLYHQGIAYRRRLYHEGLRQEDR